MGNLRKLTRDEQKWFEQLRAIAIANAPYMADIAYIMVPVMDDDLGTFATDRNCRVYLSRTGMAAEWTVEDAAWVFIHECMHVMRNDFKRSGYHDAKLWNIAMDCEINDDIKRVGTLHEPTPGGVAPHQFGLPKGKSAEYYYKKLESNDGDGSGDDNSQPDTICGGHGDSGKPQPQGAETGRDEADVDMARESAAQAITDAVKNATPGTMPGSGLIKIATDILGLHDDTDWVEIYADIVAASCDNIRQGKQDVTMTRSNRRFEDLYIPAPIAYAANIGVIIDVSASMNKKMTRRCIDSLHGIIDQNDDINVRFVAYDIGGKPPIYNDIKDIDSLVKTDGGTGMGMAIDYLTGNSDIPLDVVTVLTDGETDWNSVWRGPVIAGIVAGFNSHSNVVTNIVEDNITFINIKDD